MQPEHPPLDYRETLKDLSLVAFASLFIGFLIGAAYSGGVNAVPVDHCAACAAYSATSAPRQGSLPEWAETEQLHRSGSGPQD